MSGHAGPLLLLNLGSEMVFVVAQRLQAQNINHDRARIVLDDIVSALISRQLVSELSKLSETATPTHDVIRGTIEDVAQCSAMRLDPVSMSKLWDLITMIFKWQVATCPDVLKITTRHLYEIETYATNPDTQLQLEKVQNMVDDFNAILTQEDKDELRDEMKDWLKDFHVRVSLLLRMGLQSINGSFVLENLDPIAEEMLRNIGENVYAVTQNGRILENQQQSPRTPPRKRSEPEVNELQLFVDQMIGNRKLSSGSCADSALLKLSIADRNQNVQTKPDQRITTRDDQDNITGEFTALEINDNGNDCLKDELLNMIGGEG